jgi:hypothetical protein
MIFLQTFDNPIWTVTEVGNVYLFCIIIGAVFTYFFINSFIEAIKDVVKIIKSIKKKYD